MHTHTRFTTDPALDELIPKEKFSHDEELPLEHEKIKEILLKAIKITLDKRVPEPKDEDTKRIRNTLKGFLEYIVTSITFHTLGNPDTVNALARHLFRTSDTVDVIFTLRSVFFSLLDIPIQQKKYLVDKIAFAIYIPYMGPKDSRTIVPDEIIKRVSPVSLEQLQYLLEENDYLIPLILMNMHLSMLDIVDI